MALIAAGAFAVSCFLPFYRVEIAPSDMDLSLYESLTIDPGGSATTLAIVGAWLFLFGAPAIIASACVAGLTLAPRRWLPITLLSAVSAWGVTMLGLLLQIGQRSFASVRSGYWLLMLSVGVALAGTLVVITDRTTTGASVERSESGGA